MNLFTRLTNNFKFNSSERELIPEINPITVMSELVPETKPITAMNELAKAMNELEVFMKEDFYTMGERDGYEYHTRNALDNKKSSICSEFEEKANEIIKQYQNQITTIKNLMVETRDIDARRHEVLENDIDALRYKIEMLEKQIYLSGEEEGKVSSPLRKYQDGFIRGMHKYQDQERFAASTGMFFSSVKH